MVGHIPILFLPALALLQGFCDLRMPDLFYVSPSLQKMSALRSFDDDSMTGPGKYGKDGYGYYTGSDDITSEKLD
jgi:hypothetical protein